MLFSLKLQMALNKKMTAIRSGIFLLQFCPEGKKGIDVMSISNSALLDTASLYAAQIIVSELPFKQSHSFEQSYSDYRAIIL